MRALILAIGIVLAFAALAASTFARLGTGGRSTARVASGALTLAALAAGLLLIACSDDDDDETSAPVGATTAAQIQYAATAAATAASHFIQAAPTAPPEAGGSANPNDRPLPLMYFEGHGVNPFIDADEDALSTFALDGDTASYEILALYLAQPDLPPPDAVRVEEFINSLRQDYPAAEGALGLHLDAAPSPFGEEGYVLLRVGVSNPAPRTERGPVSLIFVVDVSGSMEADNRIGVARTSLSDSPE